MLGGNVGRPEHHRKQAHLKKNTTNTNSAINIKPRRLADAHQEGELSGGDAGARQLRVGAPAHGPPVEETRSLPLELSKL